MTALGSDGQAERWFGPPLEEGVHLRWTFRSELGFPFGGFRLYRRPHISGAFVDLPLAASTSDVIELPEVARALIADFVNPFWLPLCPAPKPLPTAAALFDDVQSAVRQPSLSRRRAVVSIEQDAITAIRVTAPRRWKLQRLRYIPIAQDENVGWSLLRPICLPLTDPNYPCHAGPTNVEFDFEEAKARLTVDGIADPVLLAEYLPADEWPQFHEHMRALCNPPIPASLALPAAAQQEPAVNVSTVDWMLLGAVDPYFARIIGVYAIDRTAGSAPRWDYRLAGRWLKTQLKSPEMTIDFEHDRRKRRYGHTFVRENLILRSAHRGEVEVVPDPPWNDTRHALDLQPFTPSPVPHAPSYLRIQFEQPVTEVQVYLRVYGGEPRLRASVSNAVLSGWKSADGKFAILSAGAPSDGERIEFVTMDPASGDLHLSLCKIGVLNEWSAPMTEEREWITYNVGAVAPSALAAPTGLAVDRRAAVSRELANDVTGSSALAALRWDVPAAAAALEPHAPLRYVIERQRLGSGDAPAQISAGGWEPVNRDSPAGIPADDDAPGDLYVDDPALPTGSADRFYAYRVAAVDLFGRVSPFSAPFIADLIDREPPPPPANVVATYLHDEHALHVRWNWTPSQRRQAPDAREFSVYARRGRLNARTGRITAVTAGTGGSFVLITDTTVPANAANALAGEWLLNSGVYYTVLHNSAGDGVQITVRPPAAPPPAQPSEGPFTVSIRPPRVLAGTVTKARGHLAGTVTLHTDQRTDLSTDALAGKWLQQGGALYRIVSNTAGDRLRLVVKGRGRPSITPGKGKFTVIESDRTTPFLADAGNVLHVDYARSENWPERLHAEVVAGPIAGEITSVVVDAPNGRSVVTINAPPAESAAEASGGMISNAGQAFRVIDHSETTLTVENFMTDDETTYVPSPGTFEYHLGYEVTIPFVLEPIGEGVAYAQVALSTTDHNDNEGALSAPVQVQTPQPPPKLERPDAPVAGNPTAADYYGESFVTVEWEARERMQVHVYRAMDEAIVAADRAARATRSTQRAAYPSLTDAQFESLVAAQPAYDNLSDEDLQIIAGLTGNDAAFGLVTRAAIAADSYVATVDGRASNRHCFAIKYVDAAGNRTALSRPSRAVRPPRVLAPRAPIVTKIVGGDRRITLQWAASEVDVIEYRIYRAGDEQSAEDVRTMTFVGSEPAGAGVLTYEDSPLPGLVPFFYRVVAVNAADVASRPSLAVPSMAFDETPPIPPVPSASWIDADGGVVRARIAWPATDASLLQRRVPVIGEWRAMTGWLTPSDAHEFIDQEVDAARSYEYRVWARKATGAVAIGSAVVLPPAH